MTTKTKVVIVLAVVFLLFAYWLRLAVGAERTHVVHQRIGHGVTFTTYQRGICTSGGNLRGWVTKISHFSPSPEQIRQWTFGPWSGSFCSTSNRITSVRWGGEPECDTNPFLAWSCHRDEIKLVDKDQTGDNQFRKWRGLFTFGLGPFRLEHQPWLRVSVSPGNAPNLDQGCGGCP